MKKFVLLTFLLFSLSLLSACTRVNKDGVAYVGDIIDVDADGNTKFNDDNLQVAINSIASTQLQKIEQDDLLFMLEEEKLAQDVYAFLYDKWSQQVFSNIGQSETTHVNAVKTLLDKYDVNLPANLLIKGEFTNQDLQKLYNDLTKQGEGSLVEALRVGAAIEEIDILDLEKRLVQTDKQDIELVYNNLIRGSRNHLRAFVSNMKNQGQVYQPQYLAQTVYDQIIASENEKGVNNQGSGRGKR